MIELTITKYVAIDGKEFKDETECMKYESELLLGSFSEDLKMWDSYGDLITKMDSYNLERIAYVSFKSEKAYQLLQDQCNYYGYTYPYLDDEKGYNHSFFYDFDIDEWYSIEKKIEELQNEIDNLKNYLTD